MRYVKNVKVLLFFLSVVGLLSIASSQALACSCISRPQGKEALKSSRVAFRGTVTNVDYLDTDMPNTEPRIVVTFSVSRVWKGLVRKKIVLHTVYNKFTCQGYYFQKGKDYLVFAYPNEEFLATKFLPVKNTLGTNYCNGTSEILAKDPLKEMGKGWQPK